MRRLGATITLAILAVAVLAGCGPTASTPNSSTASTPNSSTTSTPNSSTTSTPNVVGLPLDQAHQAFEALGIKEFDDKDAFENRTAMVESNWAVLGQDPAAGTTIDTDTKIKLTIGKISEDRTTARLPEGSPVLAKIRAEAAAQKADAQRKAAADKAVADKDNLTAENNREFATLLAGPKNGKSVEAFSEKYRVKTVEFDGFVADVHINPREHNGASTIDVMAGDASDSTHTGPVFQLSWYGHESPMEKFAKDDSVHVTALVGAVYEFDPHQFFLVEDEGANALAPR